MNKSTTRSAQQAARVQKTADLTGVSTRQVYRVINGKSENEEVMSTYMLLSETESALITHIKTLVPLTTLNKKRDFTRVESTPLGELFPDLVLTNPATNSEAPTA
jgi:hypothetical protein